MRLALSCAAVLLMACGGASTNDAGMSDATVDAGRPGSDSGCGPVPSGTDPECVTETCFGGLQCVNGPCPYPCCVGGVLMTCEIPDGYECNVVQAIDCGGGVCVEPPNSCP